MITFAFVALLAVLTALGLLLWPLLRVRPPAAPDGAQARLAVLGAQLQQLDAARAAGDIDDNEREQELRALHEQAEIALGASRNESTDNRAWPAALALTLLLPLGVLALYVGIGQPSSLAGGAPLARAADDDEQVARTGDLARQLAAKLESEDGDAEAWLLLARTWRASGDSAKALTAYRKAVERDPRSADLLIEHASVLVERNGKRFGADADALVVRALDAEPDNLNALAMAGASALQRGEHGVALKHWSRLHSLVPQGEDRERAAALVALASGKAAPPATAATAARPAAPKAAPPPAATAPARTPAQPTGAADAAGVSGTVSVSAELVRRLPASGTLFVFARSGSGPPIAALRLSPAAWPVAFTLDDTHSMLEGARLSSLAQMTLVARLSREGNATRRPGDIEGSLGAVTPGSRDLRLVLDRMVE